MVQVFTERSIRVIHMLTVFEMLYCSPQLTSTPLWLTVMKNSTITVLPIISS